MYLNTKCKKVKYFLFRKFKKKIEDFELWIDIDRKIVKDKKKCLNYKKRLFF